MLQILKDGREIFYGEVRESEESLDMVKQVYAVGELAFCMILFSRRGGIRIRLLYSFYHAYQ